MDKGHAQSITSADSPSKYEYQLFDGHRQAQVVLCLQRSYETLQGEEAWESGCGALILYAKHPPIGKRDRA